MSDTNTETVETVQYKGIIRIRSVDLANWASMNNIYNTIEANNVRFGSEGMETVIVYLPITDSIDAMLNQMNDACDIVIEKFGVMNDNIAAILGGLKAILADTSHPIKKDFHLQVSDDRGVPSFVEVQFVEKKIKA